MLPPPLPSAALPWSLFRAIRFPHCPHLSRIPALCPSASAPLQESKALHPAARHCRFVFRSAETAPRGKDKPSQPFVRRAELPAPDKSMPPFPRARVRSGLRSPRCGWSFDVQSPIPRQSHAAPPVLSLPCAVPAPSAEHPHHQRRDGKRHFFPPAPPVFFRKRASPRRTAAACGDRCFPFFPLPTPGHRPFHDADPEHTFFQKVN